MERDQTSLIAAPLEVRTPYFRVGKVWQWDEHSLLLQLLPANRQAQEIGKKLFLALKVHPQHFGVTLVSDKPQIPDRLTTPAQILRKYLTGSVLLAVRLESDSDSGSQRRKSDVVVEFGRGAQLSERSLLLLTSNDGGLMELVVPPAKSMLRFGGKGCFTKPKDHDASAASHWENPAAVDTLPELYKGIAANAAKDDAEAAPILSVDSVAAALRHKFKRRLRSLLKAREKNLALQQQSREVDAMLLKARLLQQYSYLIRPDAIELRLLPEQTALDKDIVIELNPELSAGGNIEACFVKAKKQQRTAIQSQKQLEKIDHDIAHIERFQQNLQEGSLSTQQQMQLLAELDKPGMPAADLRNSSGKKVTPTMPAGRGPQQQRLPYWIFESASGARIMVGKSAADNDELTKKAKANDLWLHAIVGGGSHVIVPAADLRGSQAQLIQREAQILALFYSSNKNDFAGEVYMTYRRHLRKTKGLAVGKWLVDKSETCFLRYKDDELQAILARRQA